MKTFTQTEGTNGIISYGLYKMFKSRFKGIDKRCLANVGYLKWLRICKKFNQRKMMSIFSGIVFKMPFRLGSLGLIQAKPQIKFDDEGNLITRNLRVDWNKTLILWRKMYPECETKSDYKGIKDKPKCYYTNEHTDGRVFHFHWKKKHSNVKNKSVYAFNVAKQYRQKLNTMIIKNSNIQFCTKF